MRLHDLKIYNVVHTVRRILQKSAICCMISFVPGLVCYRCIPRTNDRRRRQAAGISLLPNTSAELLLQPTHCEYNPHMCVISSSSLSCTKTYKFTIQFHNPDASGMKLTNCANISCSNTSSLKSHTFMGIPISLHCH